MGEQASLPPRVLQTAAALFQEGEKIPSRTPCRGQPRDLGRALEPAGKVTGSAGAAALVGAVLPAAWLSPLEPAGAGEAEDSLRRTKMKLLLSARIHTPKPRITPPRI